VQEEKFISKEQRKEIEEKFHNSQPNLKILRIKILIEKNLKSIEQNKPIWIQFLNPIERKRQRF